MPSGIPQALKMFSALVAGDSGASLGRALLQSLRKKSMLRLILGGCDNWPIFRVGFSRRRVTVTPKMLFPQPVKPCRVTRKDAGFSP
jgi:hypothetical protein